MSEYYRKDIEMAKLKEKLDGDYKAARKGGEETAVATLSLLLSEIRNAEIEKQSELDDEAVMAVIRKEVNKRSEAEESFEKAGRDEAAAKEKAELKVLEGYLPEQMSDEALTEVVKKVIKETGASGPQDMGQVMGKVMAEVKGQADGGKVNEIVKKELATL